MSDDMRFYNSGQEDDEGDSIVEEQAQQNQQIVDTGTVTPTKGKHVIHCLTIVGQIEGHYLLPPQNKTTKYEHVIPQLVAIEENPEVKGMIVLLNTVGGDVEAGLAISELISGMKKPSVSVVLGGGHSIGVPLAVSTKKSFIVPSATMTLHPVRMSGTVLGVPQTLSYFDKMQERIISFVERNSGLAPQQFRHMIMNTGELVMDMGTVLDGKKAVSMGLIDHLGGLSDAIACLYGMIEEREEEQGQEEADFPNHGAALASPRAIAQARRQEYKKTPHRVQRPRRVVASAGEDGQQTTSGPATGRERQNTPPQGIDAAGGGISTAGELRSPGDDDPHSDPQYPHSSDWPTLGHTMEEKQVPAPNAHTDANPFGHPATNPMEQDPPSGLS